MIPRVLRNLLDEPDDIKRDRLMRELEELEKDRWAILRQQKLRERKREGRGGA